VHEERDATNADDDPSSWFAAASLGDRRRVVAGLVDHVSVSRGRRGRRFDPETKVGLAWRPTAMGE
jgi:hypothetical protein